MASWDEDSPQLRHNLGQVFDEIALGAMRREHLSAATAKRWHALLMSGLAVPDAGYVGAYRGEPGLEALQVRIGVHYGVDAVKVAGELANFEFKLQTLIGELDAMVPVDQAPDSDRLAAVVDLCAWVHAEWVRIHPFANGNGRTARLWGNGIAMRYELPPFVRLRPRPNCGYAEAGARALEGDWEPTAVVFRKLLTAFLGEGA